MRHHLSILIFTLILFSCEKKEEKTTESKAQLVKIVEVQQENRNTTKVSTGISIPQKEVQLSFRVSGPLKFFKLEEGQKVVKGQTLGIIDQRDYKIELHKAKSTYQLANTAKDRAEKLFERKNISEQVYDKTIQEYEQAKSNLKIAENALKDTKLIAPFSGHIKQLKTEKGEHVAASQTVVILQNFAHTRIRCTVPEEVVLKANKLKRVSVVFDSKPNKLYSAKVIEVLHDTEQLNNAYPMLLEIQEQDQQLIAGMTAEVYLNFESQDNDTVLLPSNAVMGSANGEQFVWGVNIENQTLKKVNVKVQGLQNDSNMEVLLLGNTDWVVAAGGSLLVEGQKIRASINGTMITKN